MRIFFSMWHLGSFRMHEPAIRDLAGRGHEIHAALGHARARQRRRDEMRAGLKRRAAKLFARER